MTMLLRRQMMRNAGDWHDLYQQVEYLESSGTQWIDTLYRANNTTTVDITFKYTGPNQNADQNPCGGRSGLNVGDITLWANYQRGLAAHRQKSATAMQDTGFVYSGAGVIAQKMHVVLSPETFSVDGQVYFTFDTPTAWEAAYSMYMFRARNGASGFCREATNFAIYGMKISDSGGLKADFIPCYRKADNKPGMHDTVSGTFYTNAGTGEFVVGNKGLVPDYDDLTFWNYEGYINSSGSPVSNVNYRACDYFRINPDTYYTLSIGATGVKWIGICFYDANYTKTGFRDVNGTDVTLQSTSDSVYCRLYYQKTPQWLMFTEGQTPAQP